MGCLQDKKRVTSYENNLELAQKCADFDNKPQRLFSIDNGKTWRFEEINGVYEILVMPKKKPGRPKTKK